MKSQPKNYIEAGMEPCEFYRKFFQTEFERERDRPGYEPKTYQGQWFKRNPKAYERYKAQKREKYARDAKLRDKKRKQAEEQRKKKRMQVNAYQNCYRYRGTSRFQ